LPPCVSHVVDVSPGCPGCPVCEDILPYSTTPDVSVQVLPDLIVTAPTYVLDESLDETTKLQAAIAQVQTAFNGLSDPDKALVSKAADKAVASALDKLYPPPVPSATKAEAVNNAISQLNATQPTSPVLTAIKAIVAASPTPDPLFPPYSAPPIYVGGFSGAVTSPLVASPSLVPVVQPRTTISPFSPPVNSFNRYGPSVNPFNRRVSVTYSYASPYISGPPAGEFVRRWFRQH